MLNVNLDKTNGIAILKPDGALAEDDFKSAAKSIDGYIEKSGKLNGIIIQVESFPGWDSFSGFTAHMKFIKEHHKKVSFIAFVTDSPLADIAEHVANHFVNAEVKHFSFNELDNAIKWICGN
ncbi:MAG: STAS/SEC14 domain-containing protein [Sulfurovum sp.]|uniref:STAS/SEC14 domain-containing protein n=1 Tax=Sulfurovum sp. TaxID=1969726 RepID=UPI003C775A84